ncbi:MAG: DEAD/DEAH box helicase [Rubrivivax sp.]|nr:DEAD/DEAH box helicase [Rubrivivax sp.]
MPPMPAPSGDTPVPGLFRPRLTLQTLTRGDGLLGARAMPGFGPRSTQLTVASVSWTYETPSGLRWETPAPTRLVNSRPPKTELLVGAWHQRERLQRDHLAEADARDALWGSGLRPYPEQALQWRSPEAGEGHEPFWSLPEESNFGDFWAEQVPRLQKAGWRIVVRAGFAHQSVPVQRWKLSIDRAAAAEGAALGAPDLRELAEPLGPRQQALVALRQPYGEGSWLLSLGVEVEGETLDLTPLLADLLRRDARWLDAHAMAAIDDNALIVLRAPGGRRIEAPAAPLKAIVGAMVDLLTDPARHARAGLPMQLSRWEAQRVEALRQELLLQAQGLSPAARAQSAGPNALWQLQGDAGLATLVQRLAQVGSPPEVPVPQGLGLTLRPYQRQGLDWLQYLREHGLAGILADDMGLGKTAQVLAHLLVEQQAGRADRPSLVVLPTSLVANWRSEAQRITPALRVLTLHGSERMRDAGRITQHDVVFTTYPLLWRDIDVLAAQPWHLLILDEAQMVKNAGSRAAGALRRLQARHRLCVTGTPLENHLGELWSHMDFLLPGYLGDSRSFTRLWRRPIEGQGHSLRAQRLAQRVRPFILRRRKQDVAAELPAKTEVLRRVVLEGAQRALYESVRLAADEQVRRVLKRQGFAGGQIAILDALLKLRQVCCDPWLLKGAATPPGIERAKMTLLCEMLTGLVAEGHRVLVFSQFTEMLSLVERELARLALPHLVFTGQTPAAQRGDIVQRFQAHEVPVMLLSLKAGGVGLNLTAADTVIHLDPWWNPAVERQATDRAHRLGQDRPVFVYQLVVEGSIEERMLALQARKAALAEGVLGHDTAAAAKFTEADLRGLLAPLGSDDGA